MKVDANVLLEEIAENLETGPGNREEAVEVKKIARAGGGVKQGGWNGWKP